MIRPTYVWVNFLGPVIKLRDKLQLQRHVRGHIATTLFAREDSVYRARLKSDDWESEGILAWYPLYVDWNQFEQARRAAADPLP